MEGPAKSKSTGKIIFKLSWLVVIFAIVEPIFTVPQIWKVWVEGQTAGVSTLTWFFFTITATVWAVYGAKQNDKPLIISGALWAIANGAVFVGALAR